ncbi:MAG: nitroreductase family protein [Polyangiaceae bacterium]
MSDTNPTTLHDPMASRRSPRSFSERPIGDTDLQALFEAARWAPSCFNEQPWRFMVARRADGEAFAGLLACLVEQNQAWAKEAQALVLSLAVEQFKLDGRPNRWAQYDVGQAMAQLVLEAQCRGISAHQMGGFSVDKVRELYALPATVTPMAVMALGYAAPVASLDGEARDFEVAPRRRQPQSEFVFSTRFDQAAKF